MKVYLVFDGEYESHSLQGVYATLELAQEKAPTRTGPSFAPHNHEWEENPGHIAFLDDPTYWDCLEPRRGTSHAKDYTFHCEVEIIEYEVQGV